MNVHIIPGKDRGNAMSDSVLGGKGNPQIVHKLCDKVVRKMGPKKLDRKERISIFTSPDGNIPASISNERRLDRKEKKRARPRGMVSRPNRKERPGFESQMQFYDLRISELRKRSQLSKIGSAFFVFNARNFAIRTYISLTFQIVTVRNSLTKLR